MSSQNPRATSSGVIGRRPMRFVNHAESGTSSSALTLTASPPGRTAKKREIGRKTIWLAPSHAKGDSYASGKHAAAFTPFLSGLASGSGRQATRTGSRSVSRVIGALRGKRRIAGPPQPLSAARPEVSAASRARRSAEPTLIVAG